MSLKIIMIPGNGSPEPTSHWFPWLEEQVKELGIPIVNERFPDPEVARREYWIPHIEKLGTDDNTILIGHSSGAVAAMRYAEDHKIFGTILISACHTDLGLEEEKLAGYYDESWKWNKIVENQNWIVQFASVDDQFIPIEEQRYVHEKLNTEYHEFKNRGHFLKSDGVTEFPELLDVIRNKIGQSILSDLQEMLERS